MGGGRDLDEPIVSGPGLRVYRVVTGVFQTITYIVKPPEGGACIVVDPGDCGYEGLLESLGCTRVSVVSTHGHFDHVLGVDCLPSDALGSFLISREDWPLVEASIELARMAWGISVYMVRAKPTGWLEEGSRICIGELCLTSLHTPGHSPGHMALLLPLGSQESILFSGDLLFKGSVGRTDLPGGDWRVLKKSLSRIMRMLGDDTLILPGHGEATRLGDERRFNPFVKNLD